MRKVFGYHEGDACPCLVAGIVLFGVIFLGICTRSDPGAVLKSRCWHYPVV